MGSPRRRGHRHGQAGATAAASHERSPRRVSRRRPTPGLPSGRTSAGRRVVLAGAAIPSSPMPESPRLPWRTVAVVHGAGPRRRHRPPTSSSSDDDDEPRPPAGRAHPRGRGPDLDEAAFTTFDGEEVPLDSLHGTPTVVNFFASTCVPCITEMPAFEEVHQDLGRRGRLPRAGRRRPARGRPGPRRPAPASPTRPPRTRTPRCSTPSGRSVLPTTVLLDADGDVVATHTGELDADELRRAARRRARHHLVIDATLALAFASGMLATVNPCGFAMLPAYLGYFLGLEGGDRDVRASVSRSLGVGLSVSAGFLLVFSVVGRGHLPPVGVGLRVGAVGHDRDRRRAGGARRRHAARLRADREPARS